MINSREILFLCWHYLAPIYGYPCEIIRQITDVFELVYWLPWRMFNRKTIRIQGYNYKSSGYYFVTFCTENRLLLFGDIINGIMHVNDAGRMVQTKITNTRNCYPGVSVDMFIVMPDHVHAIIVLDGPGRTQGSAPTDFGLPEIVKNIKTCTTRCYIQGVHQNHWQPFHKRLWQRGYYERIIRNPNNLNIVREYIINNPATWHLDNENSMTSFMQNL